MGQPAGSTVSPGISLLHSTRSTAESSPPSASTSDATMSTDNTGVGRGPGPLRHPRPLTAADLHLQLEKEQEAVVNRLTRELSLLRQQSASVVSTNSSISAGIADATDQNANHMLSGTSHPTPSRRHRSSSSLSTRSINLTGTSGSGLSNNSVSTNTGISGNTGTGIAPAREGTVLSSPQSRDTVSRQNSMASSRRSEASSPSLASSLIQGDHFPPAAHHRQSSSSYHHNTSASQLAQPMSPANPRPPSRPSVAVSSRYEEAAQHRSELEVARRENEILKRRIRDLERSLRNRRPSYEST